MKNSSTRIIKKKEREFYDKWYYPTIKSLIDYYNFRDDFSSLAKQLRPPITPNQAKTAVKVLEKHKFISRDNKTGYYKMLPPPIIKAETTWPKKRSYIKAMGLLGNKALDTVKRDKRYCANTICTLSKKSFDKARVMIKKLENDIVAMAVKDKKVDSVYSFNLNFFPVTNV